MGDGGSGGVIKLGGHPMKPAQITQNHHRSKRTSSYKRKTITDQKEPAQSTQNHHRSKRTSSYQKEPSQIKKNELR